MVRDKDIVVFDCSFFLQVTTNIWCCGGSEGVSVVLWRVAATAPPCCAAPLGIRGNGTSPPPLSLVTCRQQLFTNWLCVRNLEENLVVASVSDGERW